jgi:hypothetical protein
MGGCLFGHIHQARRQRASAPSWRARNSVRRGFGQTGHGDALSAAQHTDRILVIRNEAGWPTSRSQLPGAGRRRDAARCARWPRSPRDTGRERASARDRGPARASLRRCRSGEARRGGARSVGSSFGAARGGAGSKRMSLAVDRRPRPSTAPETGLRTGRGFRGRSPPTHVVASRRADRRQGGAVFGSAAAPEATSPAAARHGRRRGGGSPDPKPSPGLVVRSRAAVTGRAVWSSDPPRRRGHVARRLSASSSRRQSPVSWVGLGAPRAAARPRGRERSRSARAPREPSGPTGAGERGERPRSDGRSPSGLTPDDTAKAPEAGSPDPDDVARASGDASGRSSSEPCSDAEPQLAVGELPASGREVTGGSSRAASRDSLPSGMPSDAAAGGWSGPSGAPHPGAVSGSPAKVPRNPRGRPLARQPPPHRRHRPREVRSAG